MKENLYETMSQASRFKIEGISILASALCLIVAFGITANAQSKSAAATNDDKAEQIIQRATEAMGGSAYLNVRTVVGHGLFTEYKDGESGLPSSFIDYIVYPDRERTEFRSSNGRIIQTNTGDSGWIFDGATKTIKDMTKAQAEDFKIALRASVEHLLRGYWQKEGAKLSYVGRREGGIGLRNEVVRLTYPDGYRVEFEFSPRDYLPMKVLYQRKTAEGNEVNEEDRLAQHLKIEGVTEPFVVDHYSAGKQTSRINYQSIQLNTSVPDSLFARPSSPKDIKK